MPNELMQQQSPYGQIFRAVTINAFSDFIWAYFSAANLNLQFKHTTQVNYSLQGQLTAQVVHPMLGAVFCGAGMLVFYKYGLKKELPVSEPVTLACVTAAVVAAWNEVQPRAVQLFKSLGYSSEAAGYLSSFFTGLTEGGTSYVLTKLIRVLANTKEYSSFRNNPTRYLTDWILQFALNVTIGASSGAVWQLVFNALTIANATAMATGVAVMSSAAIPAASSMLAISALTNSSCYQDCLSRCTTPSEEYTEHEAPLTSCVGFFGCRRSHASDANSDDSEVSSSASLVIREAFSSAPASGQSSADVPQSLTGYGAITPPVSPAIS